MGIECVPRAQLSWLKAVLYLKSALEASLTEVWFSLCERDFHIQEYNYQARPSAHWETIMCSCTLFPHALALPRHSYVRFSSAGLCHRALQARQTAVAVQDRQTASAPCALVTMWKPTPPSCHGAQPPLAQRDDQSSEGKLGLELRSS